MIYKMAKQLGQSENEIKDQYTYSEIAERNMMDVYDNYVERELMKVKQ